MTVTALEIMNPGLRKALGRSWDLIALWEQLRPTQHRNPIPKSVLEALTVLGHFLGWYRFVGVALIAFHAPCRVGEALRALRMDLVLPRDLLDKSLRRCDLLIQNPEPERRGIGRAQHATIVYDDIINYLDWVFGLLPPSAPLYPLSGHCFRDRFDKIMTMLGISHKQLLPGGLRGGGAIRQYMEDVPIATLLFRMPYRTDTHTGKNGITGK